MKQKTAVGCVIQTYTYLSSHVSVVGLMRCFHQSTLVLQKQLEKVVEVISWLVDSPMMCESIALNS